MKIKSINRILSFSAPFFTLIVTLAYSNADCHKKESLNRSDQNKDAITLKIAAPASEPSSLSRSFKVAKLSCLSCQKKIDNGLRKIDGVSDIQFDLKAKTVTIVLSKPVPTSVLSQALTELGFPGEAI